MLGTLALQKTTRPGRVALVPADYRLPRLVRGLEFPYSRWRVFPPAATVLSFDPGRPPRSCEPPCRPSPRPASAERGALVAADFASGGRLAATGAAGAGAVAGATRG